MTAAASQTRSVPLWRNVSFTLMWTSTAASGFGDRMLLLAALALLGATTAEADSTAVNGASHFFFYLPYVLFSLMAGWLADRLPRKWILFGCDQTRGALLLLSFLLIPAGATVAMIPVEQHWKVMAVLFGVGICAAVFNPARNAIVPQIIPAPQLPAANAIIIGIAVVAAMIGMVIGGEIIDPDEVSSVRLGLFIAFLFYSVTGAFFAFLKIQRPDTGTGTRDRSLRQAAKYVISHKRVLQLVACYMLVWGAATIVNSSVLALGKSQFDLVGADLIRFFTRIGATLGAGMLVGALVVALAKVRRESPALLMLGLLLAGLCVLGLVAAPWLWATYLCAFGVGVFGNVAIITTITLLQSIAPNYIRGRVMGLNSMANNISNVGIYFLVWQMPNADATMLPVLYGLGPLLILIGLWGLIAYWRRGPIDERGANPFWHLSRLFVLIWHRVQWQGRANVPTTGPVILASNHTAGLDPFLIQSGSLRRVRWLMTAGYHFFWTRPLWRAIDPIVLPAGKAGVTAQVREVVRALEAGQMVGIFPEGGIQGPERELKPFKPGIARILQQVGEPVRGQVQLVPVWVEGTPTTKNMLGHFLRPSRSHVVYGKPYQPDLSAEPTEIMAELQRRIEALGQRLKA